MKTAFGRNLRALREDKDLSQRKLANKLNITHATIAGYENSGKYPQKESIKEGLLKVLNCSEVELYGYSDGYYNKKYIISQTNAIEKTESQEHFSNNAKNNKDNPELIETCVYDFKNDKLSKIKKTKRTVDKHIADKYKKAFFIHLNDDSMDRYIAKDSYVLINPEDDKHLYNEHVCALTVDGYKTLIRRIKYVGIDDLIVLIPQSNNKKYQTETINIEEFEDFKILGRAVYFSNDGSQL